NLHPLAEQLWWSMVTVPSVGYGDFYPVTTLGRIAALFIMATGLLTLAVVTAQVASTFVDQAARRAATQPTRPGPDDVSLADLSQRLARIEQLLSPYSPRHGYIPKGP